MALEIDTYLDRQGGSLAKFTGKVLDEIAGGAYKRTAKFVVLWLDFLKGIKEAGYEPGDARSLVETFLMFRGTPQVIAGGTMEVGGNIKNVSETDMGIDIGIEFAAPALPFLGGASAGIDAGFSYRTREAETVQQNFRCQLRWMLSSGPVPLTQESLTAAAEKVLESTEIEIPKVGEEDLADSTSLLTKALPLLAGVFAEDTSP